MTDFIQCGVTPELVESLSHLHITTPTPIQSATIPFALEGRDIFASAQTGSGKTIAYSIPLIIRLLKNPAESGLVITPTRELAVQVEGALHQLLGKASPLRTALLIGGASMGRQFAILKKRPRIIVGTPGRINDHLNRGTLTLRKTSFWIIDEADRLLDMGFGIQLDQIAAHLPEKRQTLMFSATLPASIERLSQKQLTNPERICIDASTQAPPKIYQETKRTTRGEKFTSLLGELQKREGSILVFTRTRQGADLLSKDIREEGHYVDALHGDLTQRRRDLVVGNFRSSKIRILVATDIAARGIDIPHIRHVINYDLPQCPEDYIHRIGRTARAGAEGHSLTFLTPADQKKWKEISQLLDPAAVADETPPPSARQKPHRRQNTNRKKFYGKPSGPRKWHERGQKVAKTAR